MKPLAISVGDPAGIGPEVSLVAAKEAAAAGDAVAVFGPEAVLGDLPRRNAMVGPWGPGAIFGIPAGSVSQAAIAAHGPSAEGGQAQLDSLDAAVDAVLAGHARALVTGPTAKEAIVAAGTPFSGQTEHLAARSGLPRDAVTMLFLGPKLRVGLVTTHLSVRDAAAQIGQSRIHRTVRHLSEALVALGIAAPSIEVAGLNPHAGEGGLFGREEIEVIAPALRTLPEVAASIRGPEPAEAAFRRAAAGQCDGVVAMIHDQATIASKLLDWGQAVNTTWGLPFLRTSVDHGVAYDAARGGHASAEGMRAAVALAQRMV